MDNGQRKGTKKVKLAIDSIFQLPLSILHLPTSILHSPSSIIRDRRGSVAVQTFLLLPIFMFVVFGGYEFLRAMSVKQALHDGTYQAARYLALNPIEDRATGWDEVAEYLIRSELEAEIGGEQARLVRVTVEPPRLPPDCGDEFRIRAILRWSFRVPLANSFAIDLQEDYRTRVICG